MFHLVGERFSDLPETESCSMSGARARLFDVRIFYREPIYELWSGKCRLNPYVARFCRIQAACMEEAAEIAQGQFRETARRSRVRWARKVLEVRVELQAT